MNSTSRATAAVRVRAFLEAIKHDNDVIITINKYAPHTHTVSLYRSDLEALLGDHDAGVPQDNTYAIGDRIHAMIEDLAQPISLDDQDGFNEQNGPPGPND